MDVTLRKIITQAAKTLRSGGVIAYPTEAVFGLGCDIYNIEATAKILQLKHRSLYKGFIVIGSDWSQLESLADPISPRALAQVQASWPGPKTWLFPASQDVPLWVRGRHATIALRVTAHPVARSLCEAFGGPIISTSANVESFPPARDERTVFMAFGDKVDSIVPGQVGGALKPTEIRNAVTGEIIRAG